MYNNGFDIGTTYTIDVVAKSSSRADSERVSIDIEGILRNKGINSKRCKSWQENYFILIERFYQTFKDVYKYSCITGNTNALIKSVGEDNYRELVYIVQSLRELEEKEIPLNK